MQSLTLARPYDNIDMLALRALLSYEGCPDALEPAPEGWSLDRRKGRNLLYREKGSFSWVHSLTVPLWREIVEEVGEEWSEEALRYVAKVLITKSVLLEVDLPQLLEGKVVVALECGKISESFLTEGLMSN